MPIAGSGAAQRTQPAALDEQRGHDSQRLTAVAKPTDHYNQSTGNQYRVLERTVIETVLLDRINSDFNDPS